MKKFMCLTAIALALVGCAKPDVGFDTLETARKQAKDNGAYNAKSWRAETPGMVDFGLMARGDSTQSPACPQGDGWASVDVVDTTTTKVVATLKCSTVSSAVGCMVAADFKSKPYASEEGNCQPLAKVPHPLPKLTQ